MPRYKENYIPSPNQQLCLMKILTKRRIAPPCDRLLLKSPRHHHGKENMEQVSCHLVHVSIKVHHNTTHMKRSRQNVIKTSGL